MCDVAIIGAGPYGLSLAAHLAGHVNFRIFGNPMEFWLRHMPEGMHLKSEGFASSLYDPASEFTLETYCKERGLPYAPIGLPVALETFAAYGTAFQERYVPSLEGKQVSRVARSGTGFRITLEDGEVLVARRVVVAVGLTYYPRLPRQLAGLPGDLVTHSSNHRTLADFKGREVAVVGAGASAIDLAALLHQAGAVVQVIARVPKIRFHDPSETIEPSLLERLRNPITGIGPGWKLFWCTNLPLVFRQMPESFRVDKVRRVLGPRPCWFTREQVEGKVYFNLGVNIEKASVANSRISISLSTNDGIKKTVTADHVIAATGYEVDVDRLPFLGADIRTSIGLVEKSPRLSSNFQSTLPNLYFVGPSAANTFGPLLRFAYGARFVAQRLSRHLARSSQHHTAEVPALQDLHNPSQLNR